jgi:AraC-like DNA-binding protein
MSEFASAAMVRVLAQGMRDLGLDPGPQAPLTSDARVDLSLKRTLVASACAQGGWACLPLLGRGLWALSHEPTHAALASASDALDLFKRWQRLERYIHSHHRCVVESSSVSVGVGVGLGVANVRHEATAGKAAPLAAEDLVVLGVLAALLQAIGLGEVRVQIGRVPVYPQPDAAAVQRLAQRGATAVWSFRWVDRVGASGPQHSPKAQAQPAAKLPAALGEDARWPTTARAVHALLMADLTRTMPLATIASRLGVAARSLQRELGAAGLSVTRLLASARCSAGAWRLAHTGESIAEIGFLSGYADQPHFTREMQRHLGMTPAAYRASFKV